MKIEQLSENYVKVSNKSWVLGLDDEIERKFCIVFEKLDMNDITEEGDKLYPYYVSCSIMLDKEDSKLEDTIGYCGGVPIDDYIIHKIRGSDEISGEAWDSLKKAFTVGEAKVCRSWNDKFDYLQFKDEDTCDKYISYLAEYRLGALSLMIGFILDRPINRVGDAGWSNIKAQLEYQGE